MITIDIYDLISRIIEYLKSPNGLMAVGFLAVLSLILLVATVIPRRTHIMREALMVALSVVILSIYHFSNHIFLPSQIALYRDLLRSIGLEMLLSWLIANFCFFVIILPLYLTNRQTLTTPMLFMVCSALVFEIGVLLHLMPIEWLAEIPNMDNELLTDASLSFQAAGIVSYLGWGSALLNNRNQSYNNKCIATQLRLGFATMGALMMLSTSAIIYLRLEDAYGSLILWAVLGGLVANLFSFLHDLDVQWLWTGFLGIVVAIVIVLLMADNQYVNMVSRLFSSVLISSIIINIAFESKLKI